jgi:(R,R)-butanediol dehydrogenase / meso-butanediol dehydrogenase / diacetyl reductase
MRAAVLHAPHDLRVENRPEPECGPGEVILEVMYNGLCGTDATEYTKGPLMVPLEVPHPGSGHVGPTVLGHEFIGVVVDAAPDLQSWTGRRVASGAGVSCGACDWCRRGRTNLCARYYTLGLSTHGGLAQFVAAPASILRPVPEDCADIDAVLAQPLAVGLHAVSRAEINPGDSVAILGVGAIGSFVLAGLAGLAGHDGPVIAIDIDKGRLDTARALGATDTRLVDAGASAEDLRSLFPEGLSVVIESSGVPGSAQRAFALAARGGRVLLVGLTKQPQPVDLADLVLREVDVRTTVAHVCDTDLPAALDLLARRPLSPVVLDGVVPLSEAVEAFDRLASGAARGKIVVDSRRG